MQKSIILILLAVQLINFTENYSLNDSPTEEYIERAALYGLQNTRRGDLRTFASYWDELIQVTLPERSEYAELIRNIDTYCNSMMTTAFAPYTTTMVIFNQNKSEWVKKEMRRRCLEVKDDVQRVVNELITSAFARALPQPPIIDRDTLSLITNFHNVNLGKNDFADEVAEDDYQNESVVPHIPSSSPSPSATTVSQSMNPQNDSVFNLTTETPIIQQTPNFAPFEFSPNASSSPTSNLIDTNDLDYDEIPYGPLDEKKGEVREKRAVIALSIMGIIAIAGLLATSAAGVALSIDNRQKLDLMRERVTGLLDITRQQDSDSLAVREYMLGLTMDSRSNFTETGNKLGDVLFIQHLLGKSINKTATILRVYSKGDALTNTLFLNLH